jgi:hypothetical protein
MWSRLYRAFHWGRRCKTEQQEALTLQGTGVLQRKEHATQPVMPKISPRTKCSYGNVNSLIEFLSEVTKNPHAWSGIEVLDDGTIVTTQSTIARHMTCSKTTINKALKWHRTRRSLDYAGWGRRTRITLRQTGTNATTLV